MPHTVVSIVSDLSPEQRSGITALEKHISMTMRREALTEQASHILDTTSRAVHVLTIEEGRVVGYAQARRNDVGSEIEFLGGKPDPATLSTIVSELPSLRPVSVWAHGVGSDDDLALDGFRPVRSLHRLTVDLPASQPDAPPEGIALRPFRVGCDESEWLALNARSFSQHPDQGSWTLVDLERRMAEPWFDPAGFLLAERDGELVASCWTKVHDDPWGRVGEIYVIGVDPREHGRGLGRYMTLSGLHHLAEEGLNAAVLYVEADNTPAVSLYRSIGFLESWRDVKFVEDSGG